MFIGLQRLFFCNSRSDNNKMLIKWSKFSLFYNYNSFIQCSFSRQFRNSSLLCAASRLSPQEVDTILQANEHAKEFSPGSAIKSYDTNQLQSNNPIEDTRNEAYCIQTNGHLFGVFDGHGGGACAQAVAKRLFYYIAASLLPKETLKMYAGSLSSPSEPPMQILEFYNERFEFVDVLRDLYAQSFRNYVNELVSSACAESKVEDVLVRSFLRLDDDMSNEALATENNIRVNLKTLSVAMSGAVSCVAYLNGVHLHVASVGDCQAVIGSLGDGNRWIPKTVSVQHNSDNLNEINRIIKEHPVSEQDTIICANRLLGELAPLRAFGDFRYKWRKDILEKMATPHFGNKAVPSNYYTPPYLTALPDVTYHHLTPRDKFLVMATDGLWDFMSPLQVVRMIGEHMRGKTTLTPFHPTRKNMTLGEINEALLVRKECLRMKPTDKNACTHLIRNALGGTEYGLDHARLSKLLSLNDYVVRDYRDDISITVVYFDTEYLSHQVQ